MFTGIVEELGQVVDLRPDGDLIRLTVRGPLVTSDAAHGDSIAVNGVCLTVTDLSGDGDFTVEIMGETLRRTSLGGLLPGAPVNLERAMAASGRFGGHVVQGHVDGVATLARRTPAEGWLVMRLQLPSPLDRYVVEKGSITVDGVSLTVSALSEPGVEQPWFEVSLIPTTLTHTTLGLIGPGTTVNIELDVMAKYLERFTAFAAAQPRLESGAR